MYAVSDFRRGLKIQLGPIPYSIIEFEHVKPGKGTAFTRTKLRDLRSGKVLDHTFRSGEKIVKPDVFETDMQYLYRDGDEYVFMDANTYEQINVGLDVLGTDTGYLLEGMTIKVVMFNGRVIGIELSNFVVLEVTQCDPAVKGDTVTGASKPAIVETGAQFFVPLFINEGDSIKVDTRTAAYVERAKK